MKQIRISDITIKNRPEMTFREKLETAKLLDRLGADVIEFGSLRNPRADALLIKAIAAAVKAALCVTVGTELSEAGTVWEALKTAEKPRLQVCVPVSPARMEYVLGKKADACRAAVREAVAYCRTLCPEVEFAADDATGADPEFLLSVLQDALDAGANTVTLLDSAGTMLPAETERFLTGLTAKLPALAGARLGFGCADTLSLANACAASAVMAGAEELKTASLPAGCVSLPGIASVFAAKEDALCARCGLDTTAIKRTVEGISRICSPEKSATTPFEDGVREDGGAGFTVHDSMEDVMRETERLGYDLSAEDRTRVWNAFRRIAEKKKTVDTRELEVIIAAEAMQAPDLYKLESYAVTTGNAMDIVAHIKMSRGGEILNGLSLGDGPIDAAFLAIEKITGCHYELDDFQIQSITQGREAMGQTFVKLRSGGKVFSGRGISTDIIGSAIMAYINALNKICCEEENG